MGNCHPGFLHCSASRREAQIKGGIGGGLVRQLGMILSKSWTVCPDLSSIDRTRVCKPIDVEWMISDISSDGSTPPSRSGVLIMLV